MKEEKTAWKATKGKSGVAFGGEEESLILESGESKAWV